VEHPIGIARVSAPPAPALYELDQAQLSQLVEVALDRACGASEGRGQGLHLGPTHTSFVVGVVREGAVSGDNLGGNPR
jgi:hypothetical protein